MSKYEKMAIGSSLIIAIVGFIYGVRTEGVNFARAGALITIVGIVYGLLDLPSRLANIESWAREQGNIEKENIIREIMASGKSENEAKNIAQTVIESSIQEINEAAKKKRQELVLVEGAILVSGTIIWGFGDLIKFVCCCQS